MSSLRNRYSRHTPVAANQHALVPYQQPGLVQQTVVREQLVGEQQETIVNQPIVQESFRQDRVLEVQPIIHRDIERPLVNHIERHISEPAPLSRAGNIQHQPIVQETFHNRVINEVQPIIHREVAIPQVEQVQQHYVERVVAAPQHSRQVLYEQIPAQLGQQYIQQGLGTQQYLQSGLVDRGFGTGLGYPTTTLVGQQAYIQQPMLAHQPRGHISRDLLALRHGNQFAGHQQYAALPMNQVGYSSPVYGTGIPLASQTLLGTQPLANQSLLAGQTGGIYSQPMTSAMVNQPGLYNQYGTGSQFGTGYY